MEEELLPKIYIDSREQRLIELLSDSDLFEIESRQLSCGDIVLSDMAIERKTVADFCHSLSDGRLFRQLLLMKRVFRKRMLLIEGEQAEICRDKRLRGAILRIGGAMQIPVLFTTSTVESAVCVQQLAIQLFGFAPSRITPSDVTDERTRDFYQINVLAGLPGVGLHRARALLEYFGSLKSIFSATEEDLRKVPGIGDFHSRRITRLSSGK